jgi:4-hydroxythreonine-4-phosphate dehydrogenase
MKPLLLTYGMGIGPEVALKALKFNHWTVPIQLVGREQSLRAAASQLGLAISDFDCRFFGDEQEPAEVAAIRWSTEQCLAQKALGLVTGPINKKSLVSKGFAFSGHTDFLGHLCGVPSPVMSFVGGELKVALVTTHIPLMEVGAALSVDLITQIVRSTHKGFVEAIGLHPRFAVCGLNPHAGEGGVLGMEELDIIAPACEILRQESMDVLGPVSAETAFLLARKKEIDVVVAMYHDQGLAPLKAVDFGRSVNWTLGLPILRCSVDHGTACHLVGKGLADSSSMCAAIRWAETLLNRAYSIHSSHSSTSGNSPQISVPM